MSLLNVLSDNQAKVLVFAVSADLEGKNLVSTGHLETPVAGKLCAE